MSHALPYLLPERPDVPSTLLGQVRDDYERLAARPPEIPLGEFLAERYRLDLSTQYAGRPVKNPWGKASGQLSMTARQAAEDVEAGLGFIVLKTVIAQDAAGGQTMRAWAVKQSRMSAEPIIGRSGETGWTISWIGRGWWQSFDEYLQLVRDARHIAQDAGTLIVPSCKFHLPTPDENQWKTAEYEHTTARLLEAWHAGVPAEGPMPLEKDFSPTLAGSDHATAQAKILEWLRTVPRLIREAVSSTASRPGRQDPPIRVGLKLFNALFDDAFQLDMLRTIHEPGPGRPDFFIYGNRLFDPQREFDGRRGIAYGGPDLSDRNLRTMTAFQQSLDRGEIAGPALDWSATGNITTGKMALEYALRGASSFQLHTFFQLPSNQYRRKTGSKIQKALHELYLHPETGLIVWMHHLANRLGLTEEPIRFRDLVGGKW